MTKIEKAALNILDDILGSPLKFDDKKFIVMAHLKELLDLQREVCASEYANYDNITDLELRLSNIDLIRNADINNYEAKK